MFQLIPLSPSPEFNARRFATRAKVQSIQPELFTEYQQIWAKWKEALSAYAIHANTGSRLILWLDSSIEDEIDRAWRKSPHHGYMLHSLALDLTMTATADIIPEIARHGCAPVPPDTPDILSALESLGLKCAGGTLSCNRFAVLTFFPWRGGCNACALASDCPKLKNAPSTD